MTKQIHCIGRKRRCYRRPKSQAALMQPRATFCDSSGNLHRVFFNFETFLPTYVLWISSICHTASNLQSSWSCQMIASPPRYFCGDTSLHGWKYIPQFAGSGGLGWAHRIIWFLVSTSTSRKYCFSTHFPAGVVWHDFWLDQRLATLQRILLGQYCWLWMNMTIKRQSIMFLGPANAYDLDQRHNRPDKRGLLPFSHCLQPQPGKKLQPGKQPQPGKKKLNQVYKSKPSTIQ